jgi:hypothetical protein
MSESGGRKYKHLTIKQVLVFPVSILARTAQSAVGQPFSRCLLIS